MSLQVWLPLTKDLRNQGLSNVTVTNNGATFNSAGKLGGCYQTDGSHKITISSFSWMSMKPSYNFSLFLWVKGTTTGWLIAAGGWELLLRPTFIRIGLSGNGQYPAQLTDTFDSNTWYHLGFTWEGTTGQLKLYLNGLNVATSSVPSTANFDVANPINLTYDGPRYLNDVRIYDHCLSPMEVKELAKGLVLHYPLNRQGWGQENLATNTSFPNSNITGYGGQKAIEYNHSDWTSGGRYFAGDSNSRLTFTEIQANQPYTISAWVYIYSDVTLSNPGGTTVFYRIYKTGDSPNYGYDIYFDLSGITERNKWIKVSKTFVSSYTYTYNQGGTFQIGGYNGHFKVSMPKVEKGSIATPWCPNSSDTLATITGLNSTTEYDCSGFCNNGTRTGTFTWTSDTPKYSVSTNATGGASTYLVGPVLPAEAKTVALWIKCTSKANNGAIFNDKTSGLQIGLLNSLLYMNSAASTAGFTTTHWVNGEWNHVVAINNNGTRSLYVNGQAETQSGASNYYIHNADNCWLWNRSYNNSYPFTGSLCDLRIYATALSASDVKSLYQNCATIDPDGTIRGQIRS